MTMERIETIIIGGGQAGLATSYWLTQAGREHIVLEKADRPADAWRQRWDSFTLVTPNWAFCLPGLVHAGVDPDGFMPRDEIIATFERYVAENHLPVAFGVAATSVEALADQPGYLVHTPDKTYHALNVVLATGLYQRPKIPAWAADLPADLLQLHSAQYRNPESLPPGAVLVVGSGQSGSQIAEELQLRGRQVFLSVGTSGRAPRRYRGKDTYAWLNLAGFFDRTPAMLPSPAARFAANPQLSGAGGGHDLNLHQFARDGMILLGHLRGAAAGRIALAADLHESLARADQIETQLLDLINNYIARHALDAPAEQRPVLRDGFAQPQMSAVDLRQAGIRTVIWAAGYRFNFDLVKLPVTDADGFPVQQRGVTAYPGLYFIGLPWLHTQKSGLLMGVGDDAAFIAASIAGAHPA